MENQQIYILLTHTGSLLSRMIKRYTREPYSHVSVAFDMNLDKVYSFGRKNPRNPLIAGFVIEDIRRGTYSIFNNTTYSLYSLEVDHNQYEKLQSVMDEFEKTKQRSSYNLVGLLGVYLGYPINRTYAYFCSQFVAFAFEQSGISIFEKSFGLVTPRDFRTCKNLKLVKTGKLVYFNAADIQDEYLEIS